MKASSNMEIAGRLGSMRVAAFHSECIVNSSEQCRVVTFDRHPLLDFLSLSSPLVILSPSTKSYISKEKLLVIA